MKNKTKAIIAVAIILMIISPFVAYEAFLFWAHDFNPDYSKIDRCLDTGGRWDHKNRTCILLEENRIKENGIEQEEPLGSK